MSATRRMRSVSTREPAILLDVSSPGEILFLSVSNDSKVQYTALSHCWGGRQLNTTTRATFETHQQRIEPRTLFRTVQEAVKGTQALGLRYL